MVAEEHHRLELDELRGQTGRPDPRLARLEAENQRLRAQAAALREELAATVFDRDGLRTALEALHSKLLRK